MKIAQPIWSLKIICPCCEQGHPILISCPTCEQVAAACEELGTVFLNPRNLVGNVSTSASAKCPSCGTSEIEKFAAANSEQIRKAGLEGLYG